MRRNRTRRTYDTYIINGIIIIELTTFSDYNFCNSFEELIKNSPEEAQITEAKRWRN